jgi:hypothetical protein
MKVALVIFVGLLSSATFAQSESEPQQPVQAQPEAQAETKEVPRPEGRWIRTDQYGTIWIPKTPRRPTANGSVSLPKTSKRPAVDGQWVYTVQYGWLWMPYGIQYVFEPSKAGAPPKAYVYYLGFGWRWIAAPWIWGWGPVPNYGDEGPWHFAWYRGPKFIHSGWHRGGERGGWANPGGAIDRVVPVIRIK